MSDRFVKLAELIVKRSLMYAECKNVSELLDLQPELIEINLQIQELRSK